MFTEAKFVFTVCQAGAESALKLELARLWPEFRFAFSRPGFVTFKLPPAVRLTNDFDLGSAFARTFGFSLGKVRGAHADELARQAWEFELPAAPDHLHVWQRDAALPGDHDFEPGPTPLAEEVAGVIVAQRRKREPAMDELPVNRPARPGQLVMDCVLVEPNEWWIGYHYVTTIPQGWPGGVPWLDAADFISRAYLKISEGLKWSRLPIKKGDLCAEIGSAPGGSSQALLERGLRVIGIDPAEMDEQILADPNFTHVKKRAADMKRREFRDVRWLFADSNVAPKYTLDAVEDIVTHREVHVRGMLLTLKLLEWKLAEQIPEYVERVRAWGFEDVQVRQLAFDRREVCLAAKRRR